MSNVDTDLTDLAHTEWESLRRLRSELERVAAASGGLPRNGQRLWRATHRFLAMYGPRDAKGHPRG